MTTYADTINKDAPKKPMTLARFMSPSHSGGALILINPLLLTIGLDCGVKYPTVGMTIAGAAAGALAAQMIMLKANLRTAFKSMAACAVAGAAAGAFVAAPYVQNEQAKADEARDIAKKAFFVEVRKRPVADANQLFGFAKDSLCNNPAIPEANLPEGSYKLITLQNQTAVRVECK